MTELQICQIEKRAKRGSDSDTKTPDFCQGTVGLKLDCGSTKARFLSSFKIKKLEVAVSDGGDLKVSETKKIDDISAITVNATVLADIIGVTDRRIRGLAEEGILVRASKGRYNLKESLINYILTLKVAREEPASSSDDFLDLDSVKAKHEVVKMHMSELKLHLMDGTMHKSEDVRAVMCDMLVAFRTKLMSLPSKAAPVLANMYDAAQIQTYIEKEMTDILMELRQYNPKDFYSDDYVDLEDGTDDS